MGRKEIFVVFKTHFDIGFTHLAKEVIANYGTQMLPAVIKTCEGIKESDNSKSFVWTMSSWPLKKLLDKSITSEKNIEKAKQLIRNSELTWHALPFTTHTEFCGLEEYIRGLNISTDFSHEYAYWPISAKMTDVPGHTYILPTILANAGVKFLHLGCNPGCMPPDVPRLFWWQGPDDSKVLTYYSKGAYGSDILPPLDWPYDVWLAMLQTNDNVGPQDADMIAELENKALEVYPDAKITFGKIDDFYQEIIKLHLDIPVIKKDLADSWIHGVGSYPKEVTLLRRTRKELIVTEKLHTILEIAGLYNESDVENTIDEIFDSSLLFGEHTWGLDVKTHMGSFRHYNKKAFVKEKQSAIYKLMESSWSEQRDRVNFAKNNTETMFRNAKQRLCENVLVDGNHFVVFCHSGFRNDFWIDTNLTERKIIYDVRDCSIAVTRMNGEKLQLFVKNPPALGYISYKISDEIDEKVKDGNSVKSNEKENDLRAYEDKDFVFISNEFYFVKVDKKSGEIVSLIDKKQEKEWIDLSCSDGFCGYRYDKYGIEDITKFTKDYTYRFYGWLIADLGRLEYPECEHETFIPEPQKVKCEKLGDSATITITKSGDSKSVANYGNTHQIVTEITIYSYEDKVDINFKLIGKEETSYVEAIHFVFPINLENSRIRINKLGSIIDPATDIVKDANNILYCIEDFIEVTNGENSINIVSHDIPLVSIGDEGIYKFRSEYQKNKPWLYFNAMNNSWGTNFPQWMGGDFEFKFTLFANQVDERISTVKSKVLSDICKVEFDSLKSGALIPYLDLIQFNRDFKILAFKKARYEKNAYILRINEVTGLATEFDATIKGLKKICKCDLQERTQVCIESEDNKFHDFVNGFGINSYLIYF